MPTYKPNMPNRDYWEQRSLEVADAAWKETDKLEKALLTQYKLAQEDMRRDILDFMDRYAKNNNISYDEAIRSLTAIEQSTIRERLIRLQRRVIANPQSSAVYKAEISRLISRVELDRMGGLLLLLEARAAELAEETFVLTNTHLAAVFAEAYYKTLYTIGQNIVEAGFVGLNEAAITKAITYPWSGDQFSSRIWQNKDLMVKTLRQTVTQGIIQGTSTQKMTRAFNETMGNTFYNANRVIRTETAFVLNEGAHTSYVNSGVVDQYMFVATLDDRTSNKCGSLDGQVFPLEDKLAGTNAPPMHPFCRSTVIPYFGPEAYERRAKEGGIGDVVQSQTYQQWRQSNGI
ncbi:minor capsid protein [Exiguobacterium aurantiacum]|uniref:minor capsid protein n=1 Tax=Exiguobacterium aurantiacum TaxID=33987 RepID=UPI00384DEBF5